jgi:hypothetical protein
MTHLRESYRYKAREPFGCIAGRAVGWDEDAQAQTILMSGRFWVRLERHAPPVVDVALAHAKSTAARNDHAAKFGDDNIHPP